ncbi:MAG: hypothetical protein PVS3B1_19300 [Ktedonobacteraceae bacterium]
MTQQSGEQHLFYELTGQDIQITYSTSPAGDHALRFQGTIGDHPFDQTFRGSEIRRQQNDPGTLISVTLIPSLSGSFLFLTLLLPYFNMAGKDRQSFEAIAIQTTSAGPDTFQVGALQSYHISPLQGIAIIPWEDSMRTG